METIRLNRSEQTPVWITDAYAISAISPDLDGLWRELMSGGCAIKPVSHFRTRRYISTYAAGIDDLPASSQTSPHSRCTALLDQLLERIDPLRPDTHLITATTKSGIDCLEYIVHQQAVDEQEVLLSSLSERISQRLNLDDRGTNISAACASSTIAAALGAGRIAAGCADAVLVCCLDIVTEFVFSGFSALKALSPDPCKPFDVHRRGLSLGEGAAALLLMNPSRARQMKRSPLAAIVGSAMTNDATHITAPAITGAGLAAAIGKALAAADLPPEAIAAVSAHGTGTVYNDAMEIKALQMVFGGRKQPLPLYSIKGAIGHTLGAAGGLEIAIGARALAHQAIPPTVGCDAPETAPDLIIAPDPMSFKGQYLLTTNSGFGGINAAIILAGSHAT